MAGVLPIGMQYTIDGTYYPGIFYLSIFLNLFLQVQSDKSLLIWAVTCLRGALRAIRTDKWGIWTTFSWRWFTGEVNAMYFMWNCMQGLSCEMSGVLTVYCQFMIKNNLLTVVTLNSCPISNQTCCLLRRKSSAL